MILTGAVKQREEDAWAPKTGGEEIWGASELHARPKEPGGHARALWRELKLRRALPSATKTIFVQRAHNFDKRSL